MILANKANWKLGKYIEQIIILSYNDDYLLKFSYQYHHYLIIM